MRSARNTLFSATLATIATITFASSAEAISFKITKGIANPFTGATNEGAYSDFAGMKGTTTIDFNSGFGNQGDKTVVAAKDKKGKALVTYHFEKGMETSSGQTGVYADKWAPAGWEATTTPKSNDSVDYIKDEAGKVIGESVYNDSKYLAVFSGNMMRITFAKTMNYFGINWGAISGGNTFSFFRNGQEVKTFTTADVDPVAPIRASWQNGGEGSGYLHFYSSGKADIFDEIRITQAGGGGFETDNHSFRAGRDGFDFDNPEDVPEPTMTLGLVAVGGAFLLRQSRKKELA
ncbi:MAG: PEP-CTERM sorting domain-containing protein [Leptolyngbya sp. IPPAS B-1204]|nr:PEP-CTERM sorting domain-containing protein [Elainella sp. C42_A2020_010]RNJ65672.1 MAG: PEP-CTERM sorting domain-containing protein [Leptolyngbya sp. IPPAS B-1204]